MSRYALIRDGLAAIITEISQNGLADSRKRLAELSEKLQQGQFNLVIMGQFKRGKSTLMPDTCGQITWI
ncbi:MAG: hypothetical protein HC887_06120 [Desulfobacteraceae bacterium]|nr:hypothetical protein [Desulfobacteraceae bacterium]